MPELNPITAPGPDSGRPDSGGVLTIRQVNIGQGNLTYIICPNGKRVLIDAGSDELGSITLADVASNLDYQSAFNAALKWNAVANLNFLYVDVVILTHGDKDHFNQIASLLCRQTAVQWIYTGGPRADYTWNKTFNSWLFNMNVATHFDAGTNRVEPNLTQIIINGTEGHTQPLLLCDGTLEGQTPCLIWALTGSVGNIGAEGDKNTKSIIVKINYGNTSAMITGDATAATENFMLNTLDPSNLGGGATPFRSNILLVPHHGSETSSTAEFIQAVAPKTALISAKNGNEHGLPRKTIVERYTTPAMLNDLGAPATHDIANYIPNPNSQAVKPYGFSIDPTPTPKDIWQIGVSGTRSYRLNGVSVTLI